MQATAKNAGPEQSLRQIKGCMSIDLNLLTPQILNGLNALMLLGQL